MKLKEFGPRGACACTPMDPSLQVVVYISASVEYRIKVNI